MFIFAIVAGFIGLILGIKLSLIFQVLLFIAFIIYMNSKRVRRMEMAALIPMVIGFWFFVAMIIGDIYYAMVYGDNIGVKITNAFTWLFKP